jgi:hypothetical protein
MAIALGGSAENAKRAESATMRHVAAMSRTERFFTLNLLYKAPRALPTRVAVVLVQREPEFGVGGVSGFGVVGDGEAFWWLAVGFIALVL